MRRNRSRRTKDNLDRYDRVYVYWPHIWSVGRLVAHPCKVIYINMAAIGAREKTIRTIEKLDDFCAKWGVELI